MVNDLLIDRKTAIGRECLRSLHPRPTTAIRHDGAVDVDHVSVKIIRPLQRGNLSTAKGTKDSKSDRDVQLRVFHFQEQAVDLFFCRDIDFRALLPGKIDRGKLQAFKLINGRKETDIILHGLRRHHDDLVIVLLVWKMRGAHLLDHGLKVGRRHGKHVLFDEIREVSLQRPGAGDVFRDRGRRQHRLLCADVGVHRFPKGRTIHAVLELCFVRLRKSDSDRRIGSGEDLLHDLSGIIASEIRDRTI